MVLHRPWQEGREEGEGEPVRSGVMECAGERSTGEKITEIYK